MSDQKGLNPLDVYRWMLENNLIDPFDKFKLQEKFYALIQEESRHRVLELPIVKQADTLQAPVRSFADDWTFNFMSFISEAKVPARLEDSKGDAYYSNRYSEPAMKVFKKAIQSGIVYDTLLKATQLYYKSGVKFKKTIGNFFIQGDWKTCYEEMATVMSAGPEALREKIQQEITTNEQRSHYKLG